MQREKRSIAIFHHSGQRNHHDDCIQSSNVELRNEIIRKNGDLIMKSVRETVKPLEIASKGNQNDDKRRGSQQSRHGRSRVETSLHTRTV